MDTPNYLGTPVLGLAGVSTANTARDGSGTIVSAYTAPAGGALISRVVIKAEDNPADGLVQMWLDITGSAGWDLYDEFDTGDPADATTTLESFRVSRAYSDLGLPAGAKVGFSCTVAPTTGLLDCWVHGGEYGT